MGELSNRFCESPWTYCEITAGGGIYVCCPAWTNGKAIGNIFENSFEEVWNSAIAQSFRRGIFDGTYSECDKQKCPKILDNRLPTFEEAKRSWQAQLITDVIDNRRTVATRGPVSVKLCYDASCNLTCPSCRNELIIAKKEEQEKLDAIRDSFILPLLKDTQVLILSGDGDPFASNHYRDIIRLTKEFTSLKLAFHTNGVLFDEKAWNDLHLENRVAKVQISIDAATPETYAYVRRGGDFGRLMKNIHFLVSKRDSSKGFKEIDLLFVVQARNYREMPAFIRLAQELGINAVEFIPIDYWLQSGMNEDGYKKAKIWDRLHPEYPNLIEVLKDEIFRSPIVRLGGLDAIIRSEQPPEVRVSKAGIERVAE